MANSSFFIPVSEEISTNKANFAILSRNIIFVINKDDIRKAKVLKIFGSFHTC